MLIVGYCFGIRSERRLCEEVHLNLAYRWFSLGGHRCQLRSSLRGCPAWERLGEFRHPKLEYLQRAPHRILEIQSLG